MASPLIAAALTLFALPVSELRETRWLGFQNSTETSRVFIKTNEPVQYRVSEPKDDTVIIDLFNTRLGDRNQTRFLDTSQFDSPIMKVKAEELEGASRQVRVEIKVRAKTAFEVKQEDQQLNIDFKR